MTGIPKMKPILSWWQIGLLLAACGAGIAFLLPDDPRLIENLLRDGQTKEARRQFDQVPAAEQARDPQRYRLLGVQLARRELPPNDPAAIAAWWQRAVGAWRDSGYADALFAELQPMITRLPDPAAAWAVVAPDVPRAPAGRRARLVADFVRVALGASQAATAAEAFALGHPAPQRTADEALELARLWRLGGRADAALAALGEHTTPAVVERRIELLRELNRNREALAVLHGRIDERPGGVPTPAELAEYGTIALQAGAAADAVAIYRRVAAVQPADLAVARRLRDLLIAAGDPAAAVEFARRAATLSQRDRREVQELAQILEWAGAPGEAFEAWLEVARAGILPAIDRLIALNPGLYRDEDLRLVLERVVPVDGHPDYTLRLARLEVTLGRYEQARGYFERFLAGDAGATDAMIELGRLLVELSRFDDAEAWLRRAAATRPDDLAIRREIADVLVLRGQPHAALAIYAELARQSASDEIIVPYIRLAESLGRYGELVRGLRTRIAQSTTPSARDYLMLAYGYEVGDDAAQRKAALEEGLRRLPESDELRLQLASALAAEKDFVRAQTIVMAHTRLRDEPAAAELYFDLMRRNEDLAAERRFLALPFADAVARDESVRERIARAREALGELPEAERIFRELLAERPADPERTADLARILVRRGKAKEARALLEPLLRTPTPAILRLAADTAQAAGDARSAEKYQLAYLAALGTASAADWSALGDIRLSRGDRTGAKRAYAEALRRLQTQIAATAAKKESAR